MTQAASDTCTLNAKALATHQQNFEEAQKEAEDAAKLTVDDVADGTTLETLKDAITLAEAVGKRANMPRERQCQRLHQGDRRYSHVRRQPAQHHQRTRRGRQVGDRQPGTQTRVRQVSRPSQTSRQGAAPSSATPAFNGAKLRFQTTLASLKMTFATFSQPDNRPYRKSIPPSTKTRKSLLTGVKVAFWTTSPLYKRFRTVSGLYMADSTVRPEAFPDEIGYLQHVIFQ